MANYCFCLPNRSTSIGITVNPVRVPRIEEFGSLETIGQRLLDTGMSFVCELAEGAYLA